MGLGGLWVGGRSTSACGEGSVVELHGVICCCGCKWWWMCGSVEIGMVTSVV